MPPLPPPAWMGTPSNGQTLLGPPGNVNTKDALFTAIDTHLSWKARQAVVSQAG